MPLNLRNKTLNLFILFNVTSVFFVLPNIVSCDNSNGGTYYERRRISGIVGSYDDEKNHTTSTGQEEAKDIDNILVWGCIVLIYALFGLVIYLMIHAIVERKKQKESRKKAINALETGSSDLSSEDITKPFPVYRTEK
jgi:hypothetical protein